MKRKRHQITTTVVPSVRLSYEAFEKCIGCFGLGKVFVYGREAETCVRCGGGGVDPILGKLKEGNKQ